MKSKSVHAVALLERQFTYFGTLRTQQGSMKEMVHWKRGECVFAISDDHTMAIDECGGEWVCYADSIHLYPPFENRTLFYTAYIEFICSQGEQVSSYH